MKVRKIDLSEYTWEDEDTKTKLKPAILLKRLLLAPARGLNADALLKADDVAMQISPRATEVLLQKADWEECCAALNDLKGLGGGYSVLVRRVLKAPEVDVVEAPTQAEVSSGPDVRPTE
jgi:hypothetical protein